MPDTPDDAVIFVCSSRDVSARVDTSGDKPTIGCENDLPWELCESCKARQQEWNLNESAINESRVLGVLSEIERDMAADAKAFDGRPFNGRTVAEYFGNQGAAIAAIARIVNDLIRAKAGNP